MLDNNGQLLLSGLVRSQAIDPLFRVSFEYLDQMRIVRKICEMYANKGGLLARASPFRVNARWRTLELGIDWQPTNGDRRLRPLFRLKLTSRDGE